ncbi:MAG: efflux transporter, family, subunit [Verrucomicrobiales bacterium]|nr:efflux transporter, family, subunit [Verrucomicrobiales bacterium]
MNGFFKKLLVCLVLLAFAAGVWWWLSRDNSQVSYSTAPLKRGDVSATIGATGTLEPIEVVDVGAQVAGRVSSFGKGEDGKSVDYGSQIKQGELLAKIDDSVYAADHSVAKARELSANANLEQMQAKLDQNEAEWHRAQELYRSKLSSRSDFDTAKANYEVAKANVSVANSAISQAKADLEKAQRNLDFCTINSPVNGVIIDRRVNVGQTVVASLNAPSLFLIARDLTKLQIWASVNEADVGKIKSGLPVTFSVDAFAGHEFRGSVGKVRLNATMTQNVVLYTVEINVDNSDQLLLPYLTANVRFILKTETNALLVPNASLRFSPSFQRETKSHHHTSEARAESTDGGPSKKGTHTIWIKTGESIHSVEVTTGITDGANTVVSGDEMNEGDEVITGEVATARNDAKNPFLPQKPSRH